MNDAERRRLFDLVVAENGQLLHQIVKDNAPSGCAQDLWQEIRLALWRSLGTYKGRSSLATWVYRVAVNTAISFNDKNRRREMLVAALPENGACPGGKASGLDPEEIVGGFFELLTPTDRKVFTLYLDLQSYRQISEQTAIGEASLRKRVQRLKEQFQTYLGS